MRGLIFSFFIVTLAFISLAPTGVLADEYVVIDAKMTLDYRAGDVISDDTEVVLGGIARLTIMSANGKMTILEGPVSDRVEKLIGEEEKSGDETALINAVAALFKPDGKYRKSLAAYRMISKPRQKTDNPMHVSTTISGIYCASGEEEQEILWNPREEKRIAILSDGNEQISLQWPTDKDTIRWPSGISLKDGTEYTFTFRDEEPVTISIALMEATTFKDRAVFMAQNKCITQGVNLVKAHARGE